MIENVRWTKTQSSVEQGVRKDVVWVRVHVAPGRNLGCSRLGLFLGTSQGTWRGEDRDVRVSWCLLPT